NRALTRRDFSVHAHVAVAADAWAASASGCAYLKDRTTRAWCTGFTAHPAWRKSTRQWITRDRMFIWITPIPDKPPNRVDYQDSASAKESKVGCCRQSVRKTVVSSGNN